MDHEDEHGQITVSLLSIESLASFLSEVSRKLESRPARELHDSGLNTLPSRMRRLLTFSGREYVFLPCSGCSRSRNRRPEKQL